MKGIVRCKGKCPKCGEDFKHLQRIGYICPKCKTTPKRFFVDLWFGGQRIKLFSDRAGEVLDSYRRAHALHSHINYEIAHHTFDPTKYVKSESREYWTTTLMDKFKDSKLESLAPSYKKDYKRMATLVKDFLGTKDVREIRKLDVINLKTHLEKSFSFKTKTVKNIMDFFKTFLRYLKSDLEVIDTVPSFPAIEVESSSLKWLSAEEQIKLLEYIPDEDKPLLMFLMLQGSRPGEARALKCRHVNIEASSITLSATFSGRVYREKRKGRGSQSATIPIHPEILDFLKERVSNNLPEAYVFVNRRTGGPYTQNALRRIWAKVRKEAGISSSLRLYDATRHSFASQLVNTGSTIFKVSKLLGHSTTKTTEKYSHSNIESLRTDLEKLSLTTVTRLSPEKKIAKNDL